MVCFGLALRFFLERGLYEKGSYVTQVFLPELSSWVRLPNGCLWASLFISGKKWMEMLFMAECVPQTFLPPAFWLSSSSCFYWRANVGWARCESMLLLWQYIRKHLLLSYALNSHCFSLVRPQRTWKIPSGQFCTVQTTSVYCLPAPSRSWFLLCTSFLSIPHLALWTFITKQ